jgi:hypothetical protein
MALAVLVAVVLCSGLGFRADSGGKATGTDSGAAALVAAGASGVDNPAVRARSWADAEVQALLRGAAQRFFGLMVAAVVAAIGWGTTRVWWRRRGRRDGIGRPLQRLTVAPGRAPPALV